MPPGSDLALALVPDGPPPLGGQTLSPEPEEEAQDGDDLDALQDEGSILQVAAQKKAEVEKLLADAAAQKADAAKKKAKERDEEKQRKSQEKARKAAEAKENKSQGGSKRPRTAKGSQKQAPNKQAKEDELSPYELKRQANKEFNEQMLAFMERAKEAGLEILDPDKDQLTPVLGNEPTK